MNFWNKKRVALLGGANLIGVAIAKELLERGSLVLIVDDLSAGKEENVPESASFYKTDLREYRAALDAVVGQDIVFHLAAQHGGRGYVAGHDVELLDNLSLDTTIFRACAEKKVERVIFSSSACAYPVDIQETDRVFRINEDEINYRDTRQPDGAYGLEKLIGEMSLNAYVKRGLLKGCSTRSFTVFGELIGETHAIGAMIARTMIKQDPFEIWGDGKQVRNWTYVTDNAKGALIAAEKLTGGAVNIGVEDRLFPIDAAQAIWDVVGWRPKEIKYLPDKPVGAKNRVADASKLKSLGWKPEVSFQEGIRRTVEWYYSTHTPEDVASGFEKKLTERK